MSASPERRQFGRRGTCMHAVAIIPGRGPTHCIVVNLSPAGALLEFLEPVVPPFTFRLKIESKGLDLVCNVRHQGRSGVGVVFTNPVATIDGGSEQPATPPHRTGREPTPKPASSSVSGVQLRQEVHGPAAEDLRKLHHQPGRVIRGL